MKQARNLRLRHSGLQEDISRRSRTGKHFIAPDGSKRAVFLEYDIHYKDEQGDYQEIDLEPVRRGQNIIVEEAPYTATIPRNSLQVTFKKKGDSGSIRVTLIEIDDLPVGLPPAPEIDVDKVVWRDVRPGLDIELRYSAQGVEFFKILKDEFAPRKLKWEYAVQGQWTGDVQEDTVGWDAGKHTGGVPGRRNAELLITKQGGTRNWFVTEEWTGRIADRDPQRRKFWSNEVVYPLTIDAQVVVTAGTGNNTGWSIYPWTNFYDYTIYFGESGSVRRGFGAARFTAVNIPGTATVTSAEMRLYAKSTNTAGLKMEFEIDDADDPPVWSTNDNPTQLAGIAAGSFTVSVPTASVYITGAIDKTPVQSVIDRGGWSSGNAMRFALNPIATNAMGGIYFEADGAERPQLTINYTDGDPTITPSAQTATATVQAPTIDVGSDFTSVGSFITQGQRSSSTTFNTTTEANTSADALLIMILGVDNTTTSDGNSNDHSSITVDGQSATKIYEWTNGQGSAAAGTTVSVWMIDDASATTSGDAVVATIATARRSWALIGWEFTKSDTAKEATVEESTGKSDDGSDASSMSTSTMTSRSYLCVRGLAQECEDLALNAPTSGWTEITGARSSTAGGAASNIGTFGEFLISVATSFTSDPDTITNSRQIANILTAIYLETPATVVTPSAQTATASVQAPTLSIISNATITPSALVAVSFEPAHATQVTHLPSAQTATASVQAPSFTTDDSVSPSAQTATASVIAPTISIVTSVTITPSAITATASLPTATPEVTHLPSAQVATASLPAPVPQVTHLPSAQTATASVIAPTIDAEENITLTPAAQTATASVQAPVPEVDIFPAAVVTTGSVQAPTVDVGGGADITVTPAVLSVTASVQAPTLVTDDSISPAALSVTASVVAPTISAIQNITVAPSALGVYASVNAPVIAGLGVIKGHGLSDGPEAGSYPEPDIQPLKGPDYARTLEEITRAYRPEPEKGPLKVKFKKIKTLQERLDEHEKDRLLFEEWFQQQGDLLKEITPTPFDGYLPGKPSQAPNLAEQFDAASIQAPETNAAVEAVSLVRKLRKAGNKSEKAAVLSETSKK